MSGRLTDGFRDIIELRWSDLVDLEESPSATNFDSIVTGIARACKKGNLRAIQTALDRLDGKIAMEVEVQYPRFYVLYPRATKTADDPRIIELGDKVREPWAEDEETVTITLPADDPTIIELPISPNNELAKQVYENTLGAPADMDEQEAMEEELPTGSLRAVLDKMLDSPKSLVTDIIAAADRVDAGSADNGNPMVKSVVVAGLMKLVHEGRMSAVFEVFDQIDGKVAEKVKVLGDTYIKRYDLIAPAGAEKNEDGVYQVVSPIITDVWTNRLEQLGKGNR